MLLFVFVFVIIKCKKCKMVGDLNTMFSVPCLLCAVRCLFDIMSHVLKQAESRSLFDTSFYAHCIPDFYFFALVAFVVS